MEKNNINIFKKNFFCDDKGTIIDIFTKKDDIFLFNNQIIFKTEKYIHPIFLNYNYCFFCFNKRKTKYFTKNLIESHNNDIYLFDYIKNKRIRLKKGNNKKEKLIRRFIHSSEKKQNIEDENTNNLNINSDTDLYIDSNNKNINKTKNFDNNSNNINNNVNIDRKSLKSKKYSSSTLEDCSKSNEMNIDININIDEKKVDNKFAKIKSHVINENQLKFNIIQKNKNNEQTTKNSNIKNILNKSSDFLIFDKKEKYKKNYFSLIKNVAVERLKKLKRPNSRKKNKKKSSVVHSNKIKNDFCSICLGEIKEKYTLICGDFFCKECLYERIKSILKCISDFDKIRCPLCNELIEDNTLKRLLNENEYKFYEKIKMRIEGLKNKNLIPCPYPDCEGFANRAIEHKNKIYICQNNHYFCGKCREAIEQKLFLTKKKHLCKNKYIKTMKYLNEKKKKNIIKRCPNCDCWVQKEQNNCNNVICSNIWCNFEFCWICKSPYDDYHYKNPFSMCFGLSSINPENYLKNRRIRFLRCIFIFLIIIFLLLPFCLFFFSIIEIFIYVFGFLIEKSGLKNVKFKSKFAHDFFYKILLSFYFFISIGLIPVGYFSLGLIVFIIPFICLINKMKNNDIFN